MQNGTPGTLEQPVSGAMRSQTIEDAYMLLSDNPHLRGGNHSITIHQALDGSLVIDGRVISYHLKQIVQETVRPLGATIVNRVDVPHW
ncbi:hypothetical protein [Rosistilla oblonga]|uniref:hypothetical protein n=1 Tax=Rosistilla oblonga TaxID=2527990 RepID=UPI003A97851C